MTPRDRFVEWAGRSQGKAVVLWKGKGYFLFDPQAPGALRAHGYACACFDCSGLVTCALQAIGGPDLRVTMNAAALAKATENIDFHEAKPGDLVFYGDNPEKPEHVAIAVGGEGGFVVSADGATSKVTDFDAARANPHARIHIHAGPHFRGDYLFTRRNRWLDALEEKENGTNSPS